MQRKHVEEAGQELVYPARPDPQPPGGSDRVGVLAGDVEVEEGGDGTGRAGFAAGSFRESVRQVFEQAVGIAQGGEDT